MLAPKAQNRQGRRDVRRAGFSMTEGLIYKNKCLHTHLQRNIAAHFTLHSLKKSNSSEEDVFLMKSQLNLQRDLLFSTRKKKKIKDVWIHNQKFSLDSNVWLHLICHPESIQRAQTTSKAENLLWMLKPLQNTFPMHVGLLNLTVNKFCCII